MKIRGNIHLTSRKINQQVIATRESPAMMLIVMYGEDLGLRVIATGPLLLTEWQL